MSSKCEVLSKILKWLDIAALNQNPTKKPLKPRILYISLAASATPILLVVPAAREGDFAMLL